MDKGKATTPTINPATMLRGHWLRASSPLRAASSIAIIGKNPRLADYASAAVPRQCPQHGSAGLPTTVSRRPDKWWPIRARISAAHRAHEEFLVPSATTMSAMRLHAAGTALSL